MFECELTYPKIFCAIPPCTQLSHNSLEEEISKRIKIDQADTYKAPCTEHQEVYQCIPLLPKPIQLRFSLETEVFCNWSAQFDGNHLSNERKEYDVVSEEKQVLVGLCVERLFRC